MLSPTETPIFLLPYDVLYMIFLLGLERDRHKYHTYLLKITQVCRRWRISALESKLLWTRIYFAPPLKPWLRQAVFIERSRDSLLEIEISEDFRNGHYGSLQLFTNGHAMKSIKGIMNSICPQAHRWRSLHLAGHIPFKIVRVIIDRLASLDLLYLDTIRTSTLSPLVATRWRGLENVHRPPQLRHLSIASMPEPYFSPWLKDLETLQMWTPRLPQSAKSIAIVVHSILTGCPLLRKLELNPHASTTWQALTIPTAPTSTYVHHTLDVLVISNFPQTVAACLVEWVRFPSLTVFKPGWHYPFNSGSGGDSEVLLTVLARTSPFPKLEQIEVLEPAWSIIHWEGIRTLIGLATASFRNVVFDRRGVGGVGRLGTMCPNLHTVQFLTCRGFTSKDLVELVQKREKDPAMRALSKLECNWCEISYDGGDVALLSKVPGLNFKQHPAWSSE